MIRLVLLATAALSAAPATAAHRPATAIAQPVRQMEHISVEVLGKGPPVILIPGLSMSRENWRATAQRLAPTHRVYLVEVNGFGGSAPGANLKPGILDGIVADLHTLIAAEKMVKPAVVGHSMGGTVALMLGTAHPDDAGRLLIVDALPWVALIMAPPTMTVAQIEPQAKAMREMVAARYGKPDDEAAGRAQVAQLALKPASQEAAYQWSKQADRRVTAQAFYEDMVTDLRPAMATLPMPVTLIYPWAAAGPSEEAADALYRSAYAKVPHMTFVDVADSGHFIMLDQPAAFDAALTAFLK